MQGVAECSNEGRAGGRRGHQGCAQTCLPGTPLLHLHRSAPRGRLHPCAVFHVLIFTSLSSSFAVEMAKQGCFCIVLTNVCRLNVHILPTDLSFVISSLYMHAHMLLISAAILPSSACNQIRSAAACDAQAHCNFQLSNKSGVQRIVTLRQPHSAASSRRKAAPGCRLRRLPL